MIAALATVQIGFIDSKNETAHITTYAPSNEPLDRIYGLGRAIIDRAVPISNAVPIYLTVTYRIQFSSSFQPNITDYNRKLLLLIKNEGDDTNALHVPWPRDDLFETSGVYAGIRINNEHPSIVQFADMLSSVDLRTYDNRVLGTNLVTGGLMI